LEGKRKKLLRLVVDNKERENHSANTGLGDLIEN